MIIHTIHSIKNNSENFEVLTIFEYQDSFIT